MSEGKSILKEKSFLFALRVVKLYKLLCEEKREFVMSKQLLRSGTSVGANIREAQNAESKADFIHKLAISQKECDETLYWLELLFHSDYLTEIEFNSLNNHATELLKMLRSAILTTKKK
ncbi:MAG: four helix bundle protein [Cytophagaceae bacterium]